MAKIYETHKDFERDKLTEQSQRLRQRSSAQSTMGITTGAAAWILDLYRERRPETRDWMSYASIVLYTVSIIGIVRSWFTSHKAHDLELQRERLGPEHIMLQQPASPAQPAVASDCAPCKLNKYSGSLHKRSTLEMAEKTANVPEV